jgi:fructose-1,6-bisphosphatase/inositol monophosphatase family enzyme
VRPDPQRFVETLLPALREAAALARSLEGRVENRPKAGESTPAKAALTRADFAAQEAILRPLLQHFPGVALEAEEDTQSARLFPAQGDARVVVDPIDGTLRSYLQAEGPYAVLVGLAFEDRYEAALVALPREGLFFEAQRGKGARMALDPDPFRPARVDPEARRIMVSYEAPAGLEDRLRERGYEVVHGCGGALSVAPLVPGVAGGLRLARPGASISVRGRIGALVAREAGALLASEQGTPFPTDIEEPRRALLVARDAEILALLQDALQA